MPLALPAALEPYRPTIEAAARPAIRLDAPADPTGAAAQFGGRPLVPPGTSWPEGKDGPMFFVGHVDFAQVRRQAGAAAAELPGDGASRPRPFTGPELLLGATAMTSLPTYDETEGLVAIPRESDALWETYFEELLPPEDLTMHQLLGYATWIQDDPRPVVEALARGQPASAAYKGAGAADLRAAARRWRLLWQIGSDGRAGFMWGDSGNLQVLIRDEDLQERRFERTWLTGACY